MSKLPPRQRVIGIECPKCGNATRVSRTDNFVSWIKRVRVCTNAMCRHAFDTAESVIDPEDVVSAVTASRDE